jgi:hypothetical protein
MSQSPQKNNTGILNVLRDSHNHGLKEIVVSAKQSQQWEQLQLRMIGQGTPSPNDLRSA